MSPLASLHAPRATWREVGVLSRMASFPSSRLSIASPEPLRDGMRVAAHDFHVARIKRRGRMSQQVGDVILTNVGRPESSVEKGCPLCSANDRRFIVLAMIFYLELGDFRLRKSFTVGCNEEGVRSNLRGPAAKDSLKKSKNLGP
jgi:hypothetical protein